MSRRITLTAREAVAIGEYARRHEGHSIYVTSEDGSGIGKTVKVHCADCKTFRNLTDYEAW